MRMPGQTWPGAAASFLGMWVTMMLPSLAPTLWRHREAVAWAGEQRRGWLTVLVGVGYFSVWAVFGMAAFCQGSTDTPPMYRFGRRAVQPPHVALESPSRLRR